MATTKGERAQVELELRAARDRLAKARSELRIRGSEKMSRTEAMLHYAHENPEEILAATMAKDERALDALIHEHQAAEHAEWLARHTRKQRRVA
jgi:hypothetical protein